MEITEKLIQKHGLKKEEYQSIQKLMKRNPNLLELGIDQNKNTTVNFIKRF